MGVKLLIIIGLAWSRSCFAADPTKKRIVVELLRSHESYRVIIGRKDGSIRLVGTVINRDSLKRVYVEVKKAQIQSRASFARLKSEPDILCLKFVPKTNYDTYKLLRVFRECDIDAETPDR